MKEIKKNISIFVLSILLLGSVTTVAYADDAPPSLNFGDLLDSSPPSADLGDVMGDDSPPGVDFGNIMGDEANDGPPGVDFGNILGDEAAGADTGDGATPATGNDLNGDQDGDLGPTDSGRLEISRDSISPKIFNPTVADTTLTFRVNQKSRVDVDIRNSMNQSVVKLVSNQLLTAGQYEAKWNGTTDNKRGGKVVPNGNYTYKITAKNPDTGLTKDTATGTVTVKYSTSQDGQSGQKSSRSTINFGSSSQNQAASTLAIQNRTTGRTSETGPGMLLYGAFPLAGWIAAHRKRK